MVDVQTVLWTPALMVAAACFMVMGSARSQSSQASQADERQQLTRETIGGGVRTNTLGGFFSFAPASPSDPDIGEQVLLQPAKQYEAFTVYTNWNAFWTSNPDLLDSTDGSDTFFVGTLGVNYLPYLGHNLFAEFTVNQSGYRYAKNGDLDFNALVLTAGLIYVVREWDDLAMYARYEYDLLTPRGFTSELFSDQSINFGLRKSWILNRALLAYASAGADFSLGGQPDSALRNDFSMLIGLQLQVTRIVTADLYYRAAAQDYIEGDRADFNQLIGGGFSVDITKWMSVQTLSSIAINRSTDGEFNYFAANLGGGISLQVTF